MTATMNRSMATPGTIALSLVSHTNVGKTTLARTLLGRDVGEVRDAAHVTEFADVYTLITTAEGESLQLWDTPGFGDSVRLLTRLRSTANPIGWFISAVWDRWRDRPFWACQQALRNVRDHADVVLYLVSAAEAPEAAGYVAPEMELLAWVGKPVIVLLNQLGAPRAAELEAAEVERWRLHLAAHSHVSAVLPLDAFARCWVQEFTLLGAVETALSDAAPGEARVDARADASSSTSSGASARMARLRAAWQAQRTATFNAAMDAVAQSLARIAASSEVLPEGDGLRGKLRDLGSALGRGMGIETTDRRPATVAQQALAARLDAEVRDNTAQLISLHGLQGDAQGEILSRLAAHFELRLRVDEGQAAMLGGLLTGALAGLKADIATGGLTLGGGALAGGLIGALSAAGLARCYNLVRGTRHSWLTWNADALDPLTEAALLRYLAVAHFGRGRGDWAQAEAPAHWKDVIADALKPHREALTALWADRGTAEVDDQRRDNEIAQLAFDLRPIVTQATRAALERLYPGTLPPEAAAAS